MRNFQLINPKIDIKLAYLEAMRQEDMWNTLPFRQQFEGSPFKECDDIILRFQEMLPPLVGDHESVNMPAIFLMPENRKIIFDLMAYVKGERLGRCMISRMAPGAKILPHVDEPTHADYYDRFHVVLNGEEGSTFRCGEEEVGMKTGEIWWFDNSVEHEVINNSKDDRIHLIVDIRMCR